MSKSPIMLKRELRGKYRGMHVKANYCRSQEAYQLGLAANDPVESRRIMALAAAKAWGFEAIKAEKRESKTMNLLETPAEKVTHNFAHETNHPIVATPTAYAMGREAINRKMKTLVSKCSIY